MDEKDRQDIEEYLRERTKPGLEAAFLTAMEDLPKYVMNLGMLRSALAGLEETAAPCDCGKPGCLAAPQHKALYQDQLDAALAGLREAIEESFQAILHMVVEAKDCECAACQNREKQEHAWLN